MTAIISNSHSNVASGNGYSPALDEAKSLARAKSTINSMPVGSTINHLSHVLGGIRLDLGASRAAPDEDQHAPQPDTQAHQAARRCEDIEATTKGAAKAPDGRSG